MHDPKPVPNGLLDKSEAAKFIWATITPVPDGEGAPKQPFGKVPECNIIANRVMTENGVAIDDLNAAITPHLAEFQNPKDVHYKPEGYALQSKQVAASIKVALPAKR